MKYKILISIFFIILIACSGSGKNKNSKVLGLYANEVFESQRMIDLLNFAFSGDVQSLESANYTAEEINKRGTKGYNVLMWSLFDEELKSFEWLIKNGADITLPWKDGKSSLIARMYNKDIRVLKIALDNGLDPNYQVRGRPMLYHLISCGLPHKIEFFKLLLDYNPDINYVSNKGFNSFLDQSMTIDCIKYSYYFIEKHEEQLIGNGDIEKAYIYFANSIAFNAYDNRYDIDTDEELLLFEYLERLLTNYHGDSYLSEIQSKIKYLDIYLIIKKDWKDNNEKLSKDYFLNFDYEIKKREYNSAN
ncbi:ankyrin repeat domain-containing protein [Marinicellulosiphila megalodicopiae]|uniref:ankyrin repeat domain-containing protein n=1 Tax=Marinicellulosiphila megalodicopiae TaxID=2724896 RepID=UPI003BB0F9BD